MTQGELFPEIREEVMMRVVAALENPALTPRARAVLEVLKNGCATGSERALTIAFMQNHWRFTHQRIWTDRDVKAAVKELLEEYGVPIGSARSGVPGYFLLVTPEDIALAERPIIGEIISLAKRLRATNKNSEISRTLCGQLGIKA